MKKALTILTALTMLTGAAQAAAAWTTEQWVKSCTSKNPVEQAACFMYARGVADGLDLWASSGKAGYLVCVPASVTSEQLVAVGRKFHRENPKDRHLTAGPFLGIAFMDAWPCSDEAKKELL